MKLTQEQVVDFGNYLINEEKSELTLKKYKRDVSEFAKWLSGRELSKEVVVEYKKYLTEKLLPSSVNSKISALNKFFEYINLPQCKVRALKIQRTLFTQKNKELTKAEYNRLLSAAGDNKRLYYLMQTICSTGIRVSELKFITVESLAKSQTVIKCKGKLRSVMLPSRLCKMLKKYAKEQKIKSGSIFVTKNGKPLDRSNIWREMNMLCEKASVDKEKVFPHNLRHLFARVYYSMQKDIVRLADILGHSNINTTRIYTIESGTTHMKHLQSLGLLRC